MSLEKTLNEISSSTNQIVQSFNSDPYLQGIKDIANTLKNRISLDKHENEVFDSLDDETSDTKEKSSDFVSGLLSMVSNLEKNKLKLLFGIYSKFENYVELRNSAQKISALLDGVSESEVLKTETFQKYLLEFYEYYNLFMISSMESLIKKHKETIEIIHNNPQLLNTDEILKSIQTNFK